MSPPEVEPDDEITAARYRQLNERFYAAEPADYLRTRLITLLALAGKPGDVLAILRAGVEHAGVTVRLGDDGEVDAEDLAKYVSIESQVLLHHAAETVVRLFLAHRDYPPCPWVELAGETNFAKFKERVGKEITGVRRDGVLEDEAAWVFIGRRESGPDEDGERWADAKANLGSFLRTLAERWLNDARTYNSLKHGLAVIPGDAVFQLVGDDGNAVRLGEGTSVEILEAGPWVENRREWKVTTKWIDVQECLGLVEVSCLMISSLWQVARFRYLDAEDEGQIFFPAGLKPFDLRGKTSGLHTFSMSLLEEHRGRE